MARRKLSLDVRRYSVDLNLALVRRVVDYLNWAAQNYPNQWTPYNVLCQAVYGYPRLPTMKSQQVETVRSAISRARPLLQRDFGRDAISAPGLGVRATVDDADTLKSALPKRVKRMQSAQRAVTATADIIDIKNIPDTAEYKEWKKWLAGPVRDSLKLLQSPIFEDKLLPPAPDSASEDK